jgi:hypothetical protein
VRAGERILRGEKETRNRVGRTVTREIFDESSQYCALKDVYKL